MVEDGAPANRHCLTLTDMESLAGGARPWAPGQREEDREIRRLIRNAATTATPTPQTDRIWCMSEVDIFADLDESEMAAMAEAAPMRTYAPGSLIYTPHQPLKNLFIQKKGRIRFFRVSGDGRALTTAIIEPGTIFGEMVIVGHQMHDSFAEALDEAVVCVMTEVDVRRLLLGDARIASRITEILGRRLGAIEQRLSDTVFKSVPERIAGTLTTLAEGRAPRTLGQGVPLKLTHEQLAALAGSSRETTTKVLGELADQGLIALGRGKITVNDKEGLRVLSEG